MLLRATILTLLLASLGAVLWLATSWTTEDLPDPVPNVTTARAPAIEQEPTSMELRVGDKFWGMHLDGVVPCSSMLVRGGGHLVLISPVKDPLSRCHFHVRGQKVIQLEGVRFTLDVLGEDTVFVNRDLGPELASVP
jgi:hypothetical protein